jgi:hypothetical protein
LWERNVGFIIFDKKLDISWWKTCNQIDHILIVRRRHSSILNIRSFRIAGCDIDHCLVVAKVRERLTVSKQSTHRLCTEMFSLEKLKGVEDKKQSSQVVVCLATGP